MVSASLVSRIPVLHRKMHKVAKRKNVRPHPNNCLTLRMNRRMVQDSSSRDPVRAFLREAKG